MTTIHCDSCDVAIGPANHGVTLYEHEPEYNTAVFCDKCRSDHGKWIAQGWLRKGARKNEYREK